MNKRHGPKLLLAGLAAVLAGAIVTGCTSTEPTPPPTHHAVPPAPKPAVPQPLQTPGPQKGELARLYTTSTTDFAGTGLALPPSKYGYAVEWGCSSKGAHDTAGWELDNISDHDSLITRSTTTCDGSGHMDVDSSLTAGYKAVDFHFVGNFNGNDMYAILVPASQS